MKLTKQQLALAGIAAAGLGLYFFAGPQIKSLFRKKDEEAESGEVEAPMPTLAPGLITTSAPKAETIDINKKLRKGSSGEEVKRLQFIINYIAGFRGTTSYKTPSGYTVKFPIAADGQFGSNSQAGAFFAFDTFKDAGFVTLDIARQKLAYIAGFYGKPFPSELVGTKNYTQYQNMYKAGEIDSGKTVTLPGGGINLLPGLNVFNP